MTTEFSKPAIGNELAFYSRFPEEMDLFFEDCDDQREEIDKYSKLDGKELEDLLEKAESIGNQAADQAKLIMDAYFSKLNKHCPIRTERVRGQGDWNCKIKCAPKNIIKTNKWSILIGSNIYTTENKLMLSGWIWINRLGRAEILEKLNNATSPNTFKDMTSKEGSWTKSDLCYFFEDVKSIHSNGETLDDLTNRLVHPLLDISEKDWNKLYEIASGNCE